MTADCRHCAGLSGLPPIADAGVCMACVRMITARVRAGTFGKGPGQFIEGRVGDHRRYEFLCPHGRTQIEPTPGQRIGHIRAGLLERHEWALGCDCARIYIGSAT